MKQYAGLDVSLKEVSICVVGEDGAVLARGTVSTEPDAISALFAEKGISAERIVHESGQAIVGNVETGGIRRRRGLIWAI